MEGESRHARKVSEKTAIALHFPRVFGIKM